MDRDPDAAERALTSARLENFVAPTGVPLPKSYLAGCVALMRNDAALAQHEFEAARPMLEQIVMKSSQDGVRHAQLGLLYALMGRKDDALREGQRGAELTPVSKDTVNGATVQGFLALIYARTDADRAIEMVERLLTTPFAVDYADDSITLSDLRQRWEWDPLRNDPRFQKILASPEPKTLYK
jgi:hypothetical protein